MKRKSVIKTKYTFRAHCFANLLIIPLHVCGGESSELRVGVTKWEDGHAETCLRATDLSQVASKAGVTCVSSSRCRGTVACRLGGYVIVF